MGVVRKGLNWYARLAPGRGKSSPPFEHVVQVGDPTLRKVSAPVPLENILKDEVQGVIKKLHLVLHKYGSVGMSAPQVGVNMRIFAMRVTAKEIASISKDPEFSKNRGMSILPFTVFINPKLKVLDYRKVIFAEGCESVRGFAADVPRYREVEVSAHNAQGEPFSKVLKDWSARIAQHEMDHLDGKLYVDIMDRKTLHCTCWEEVNLSKGKLVLPFCPE